VHLLEKRCGPLPSAANYNAGLSTAELNVQRNAVHTCHHGGRIQQRSGSQLVCVSICRYTFTASGL